MLDQAEIATDVMFNTRPQLLAVWPDSGGCAPCEKALATSGAATKSGFAPAVAASTRLLPLPSKAKPSPPLTPCAGPEQTEGGPTSDSTRSAPPIWHFPSRAGRPEQPDRVRQPPHHRPALHETTSHSRRSASPLRTDLTTRRQTPGPRAHRQTVTALRCHPIRPSGHDRRDSHPRPQLRAQLPARRLTNRGCLPRHANPRAPYRRLLAASTWAGRSSSTRPDFPDL
jgi:hypothetical protein